MDTLELWKIGFESFTQLFTRILSNSKSYKCAQDVKPRYKNQRYLAHASKHKILTHLEALWRYRLAKIRFSHVGHRYLLWLGGLSRSDGECLCALFLSGLRDCQLAWLLPHCHIREESYFAHNQSLLRFASSKEVGHSKRRPPHTRPQRWIRQ
jgi:hypothetical protein